MFRSSRDVSAVPTNGVPLVGLLWPGGLVIDLREPFSTLRWSELALESDVECVECGICVPVWVVRQVSKRVKNECLAGSSKTMSHIWHESRRGYGELSPRAQETEV